MKKSNLVKFHNFLSNLKTNKSLNIKFAYAIQRNLSKIQPEIDALIEVEKTLKNERVVEFQNKRIEIAKEYAVKDENGNIIFSEDSNSFNISNTFEFNKKVEELFEDYKDDFAELDKRRKEYDEILSEEIELDLVKVDFGVLPETGISAEDFEVLDVMIKVE